MAKGILLVLRGRIGDLREDAKSRHVDEVTLPETADIHRVRLAGGRNLGGIREMLVDAEGVSVVVRRTGRNVTDGDMAARPHDSGHDLVEGPVAAGGHDQIIACAVCLGLAHGIPAGLGRIAGDLVAGLHKNVHHVGEIGLDLALPGHGIVDEKQSLHG